MADKTSLGLLGFLFGGVTFAVGAIAILVVASQINGSLQAEDVALAAQVTPVSLR